MKNAIKVETWEQCESELLRIASENEKSAGPLWYRGHSDATWDLQTSLERRCPDRHFSLFQYYMLILRIAPEIRAFTNAAWASPEIDFKDLLEWTKDFDSFGRSPLKFYDYLVYLRHHNFPSPLLDWTQSPYIAAYFAFASAKSDAVAIYVYCEMPENLKGTSSDEPIIFSHGPRVQAHKRHFRQQSSYTVCMKFDSSNGWDFYPHQRMLMEGRKGQDVVWKIIVPITERPKVLRILDKYNLNAFSLFDSEEGLMETLAVREIDLSDRSVATARVSISEKSRP